MEKMTLLQRLSENIQMNPGKTTSIFVGIWLLSILGIVNSFKGSSLEMIMVLCLMPIFIYEGVLRILLRVVYGSQYKYSLWSYFLIDDPLYGNTFRKDVLSKSIEFPIFDNFVFPYGNQRILDPDENKIKRLEFNINSLGYRGGEFDTKKKNARLRIFCSGGSTTACNCCHDHETWPMLLEKFLKGEGYDVEVINAGVQAWYSYQEYLRFQNEIVHYEADIVLLHQGWNEEFEYSSLDLGKAWNPRTVRNVREENNLYCDNKLLSSSSSIGLYFAVQSFMKQIVFIPNMKFSNPERWDVLLVNDYILAWFQNLCDIARCAKENDVCLYTLDYPGLVNMSDSTKEREIYVENSRLTDLYADYQAVSKERISRTLLKCSEMIPCLQGQSDMANFKNQERLEMFQDEIHMSPKGNACFAKTIGQQLIKQESFQERYHADGKRKSNVNTDKRVSENIEKSLSANTDVLEWFVNDKIKECESSGNKRSSAVPDDRYTTF